MKIKYIISLSMILLIGIASAIIVTSNGYILDREELGDVTDGTITDYMTNQFKITNYKLMENKIFIYYNITYLEPMKENNYRVFTQSKPFIITRKLWKDCINETTQSNCIQILVNRETAFEWVNDDGENKIIISTYLQAKNEQIKQYERAKEIRDNAINNDLDYLFENLEIE